jgi:hypothetical protein
MPTFNQANYPVGMTTDANGYPIPKMAIEGRNYQEITVWNAQAIRDTNLATSSTVNTNTLSGQNNILINNTLDQPVTINIYIKNMLGQAFPIISGLSVPNGSTKVLTDQDAPVLKTPIYQLYATAQAATAPTTGGLSITVGGVQA